MERRAKWNNRVILHVLGHTEVDMMLNCELQFGTSEIGIQTGAKDYFCLLKQKKYEIHKIIHNRIADFFRLNCSRSNIWHVSLFLLYPTGISLNVSHFLQNTREPVKSCHISGLSHKIRQIFIVSSRRRNKKKKM